VSYSCHGTDYDPISETDVQVGALFYQWRWRDSNPRPPEFQ
jgi:hypothetical protein